MKNISIVFVNKIMLAVSSKYRTAFMYDERHNRKKKKQMY